MKIVLSQILCVGVDSSSKILEESIPPATELDVANFESSIGYTLPEDYRNFLLTINGGAVNRNIIDKVEYHVEPMISGSVGFSGALGLGYVFTLFDGLPEKLGSGAESLTLQYMYESYLGMEGDYPFVPPACLPIANVYDSSLMLVLDGEHKNKVLVYGSTLVDEPDELYGNVSFAGNSFSDFVESLTAAPKPS